MGGAALSFSVRAHGVGQDMMVSVGIGYRVMSRSRKATRHGIIATHVSFALSQRLSSGSEAKGGGSATTRACLVRRIRAAAPPQRASLAAPAALELRRRPSARAAQGLSAEGSSGFRSALSQSRARRVGVSPTTLSPTARSLSRPTNASIHSFHPTPVRFLFSPEPIPPHCPISISSLTTPLAGRKQ